MSNLFLEMYDIFYAQKVWGCKNICLSLRQDIFTPMRKVIALIVLMPFAIVARGQNAQITKIRQLYADTKNIIERKKDAELPPDETVVTSNYMAPGAGPIKDITHYYYSGEFDENLGNVYYTPYMMTRKYNVGASEYYEEYLFDHGDLVFYFSKNQDNETRHYWGANGFHHEDVKGEKLIDDVQASRLSYDLKEAFNRLMNREY